MTTTKQYDSLHPVRYQQAAQETATAVRSAHAHPAAPPALSHWVNRLTSVPVALREFGWSLSMAATNPQPNTLPFTLTQTNVTITASAPVSGNPGWSNFVSGNVIRVLVQTH